MQIYCYDPNIFPSLDDAVKGGGRIAAMAVLFEVGRPPLGFLTCGVCDRTDCDTAMNILDLITRGRSESSNSVSLQISREDNKNISPVTDAVNTVSRFGECQYYNH